VIFSDIFKILQKSVFYEIKFLLGYFCTARFLLNSHTITMVIHLK
jgi:hypothetical protein